MQPLGRKEVLTGKLIWHFLGWKEVPTSHGKSLQEW
jgi:hypothetical protein